MVRFIVALSQRRTVCTLRDLTLDALGAEPVRRRCDIGVPRLSAGTAGGLCYHVGACPQREDAR